MNAPFVRETVTQIVAAGGFPCRLRTRLRPSRPSDGRPVRFCVILILDRAIFRRVILPPRDILHFRLLRSLFHVKQAQFTVPTRAGLSKEGSPMKILDGFGKQCPMPLVMAKKELDAGATELAIQVDNETAVKNGIAVAAATVRAHVPEVIAERVAADSDFSEFNDD